MRKRLHFVLTLLLACLMLGAGTQSAVCELACGLGSRFECHGTAAASTLRASTDTSMAGMHCSGMQGSHSSDTVPSGIQFESHAAGVCGHPSPIATMISAFASERVGAVHWVVVEPVQMRHSVAAYRSIAKSKAPPLRSTVDPLLLSLRV